MKNFVFLQVGDDPIVEMMVHSINVTNPGSRIIQCSDSHTKKFSGVTDIFRLNSDPKNIMAYRIEAFERLGLSDPAIYLDTDILVLRKLEVENLLNGADVAFCHRSFGRDSMINIKFNNMDLSEYENMTLGEVYPIIGCFTVTKSYHFWSECLTKIKSLDAKFHHWFGDQEAMRDIASGDKFSCNYLPESNIACLPEYYSEHNPSCLHFKGSKRKNLMNKFYENLF